MTKLGRSRSSALVLLAAFLLPVLTVLVAAQAKQAPASVNQKRIAQAVDKVLVDGLQAKIPPHVSTMLQISDEGNECPVRQGFLRNGAVVRGFNVSVADKNNIVLFVTDESAHEQTYYLTSGLGGLRRVLAVRAGTGHILPVTGKEKAAFKKELQFWLDRIVPDRTSK